VPPVSLPEAKDALQAYLKKRHREIQNRHHQGASGEQIVASITDLADEVIEGLYRQAVQAVATEVRWKLEEGWAVVALGGYGRGELAPYSDIDLMFLHRDDLRGLVQDPAASLLQTLWDVGYRVGHSLRTVNDCVTLARQDLTVRTALMEARFLAGSRWLFDRFRMRYHRKVVLHSPTAYISAKIRDRKKEVGQFGTTVYLLEPHVKMSRGGLRDLHLLRWAGLAQYHTASMETLKQYGVLNARDYGSLLKAQGFLWGVRNDLHFTSGRCQDRLTFEEQIRMAEAGGFHDRDHLLAVEQFMKQYYEHTTAIEDITGHLLDQLVAPPFPLRLLNRLRRRAIGEDFWRQGTELSIRSNARPAVLAKTAGWLKMFYLAQANGLRLSQDSYNVIKNARNANELAGEVDQEAASVFLKILGQAGRAGTVVRDLHRNHLLEIMIPEFAKARGLMQFNEYHKYTVDEHCIRAVEEAEAYLNERGTVGQAYREIQKKEILHLALLVHDLGKGQGDDHSAVGVRIAEGLEKRLGMATSDAQVLIFLVRHHLLMTHIAFRRDLSDETVLLQFARTVARPDVLRKLYVLTVADVAAVGPGTLTAWKMDLLAELYSNTLEILTGERAEISEEEKLEKTRAWIRSRIGQTGDRWFEDQMAKMTSRYLLTTPRERILKHLERLRELPPSRVLVDTEYDPGRQTTEYTVYTSDGLTPGIFYKIAGALAARGLQILGATITTWKNGTVVDTFRVQDLDFAGAPTARRLEKVSRAIEDVLIGRARVEDLLVQGWRLSSQVRPFPIAAPPQIEVDNDSSEASTIIEVFAQDRQGLLFVIAKALFELGLSVHTAKVSTHLDQIVDVFYVTKRAGEKVSDQEEVLKVRERLQEVIERFLEESREKPSFSEGETRQDWR
jgi:[protein-PII] uridylyltransferase